MTTAMAGQLQRLSLLLVPKFLSALGFPYVDPTSPFKFLSALLMLFSYNSILSSPGFKYL